LIQGRTKKEKEKEKKGERIKNTEKKLHQERS
jgi:hypothetical protein